MTAPGTTESGTTAPVRGRRARRERRRGTALFVSTIILFVVALGAAAAALVVRRDTGDLRAHAEPIHREVRALTATEVSAEGRQREVRARARETTQDLVALFAAEQAQVDASNHAVDVANQAVGQYNEAKTSDVAAAFQGAGDAAIADLEAKTAAVRAAAAAAERVVAELQAAVGG
jgi:hypothetical protein